MNNKVMKDDDISPLLATANRHHQSGRLAEAEALYQEILKKYPEQPDALQFMGLIAYQKNDPQSAIEHFIKAISINPFSADYYINLGAIYKQLGRLRDALECYQTALQLQPDSAEANNNLGNVYKEQGRFELAKEAYEKAVSLKPGFINALNNIGLICQQENNLDEAEAYYRKAIEANHEYAEAHNNLGNILMAKGKLDDSIKCFQTAQEINPNYLEAQFNLGNLYASQNNFIEAEKCYRNVLTVNNNFFDALFNLGRVLQYNKKLDESLEFFEQARNLKPHNPVVYHQIGLVNYELKNYEKAIENFINATRLRRNYSEAFYNLGNSYYGLRRYQDAINAYKKSIEIRPEFSEAYNNLGNVYTEMGLIDDGEIALKKALELRPEYDAAYNNLGNIYKQRGNREEALNCYHKALSITPDYPEAHRHLALSTRYKPDNLEHANKITEILSKNSLNDSGRMHLNFALGKIYDDCQMPDKAFEYYKIANNIRHKEMGFDIDTQSNFIDQLINIYSDEFLKSRSNFGHESVLPVLIVGMPRSGTTLCEQIISSHPKAAAAGELVAIHQMEYMLGKQMRLSTPYPEIVRLLDEQAALGFANEYIRFLRTFSNDAERITDKMPDNFLSLGFIRFLFPNAHIIHCMRNPVDTCLSIYFQFFVQANGYAYDLETLGKYYNEYLRIMKHWRSLEQINMYEVQYEDLVKNQQKISKEIIEHVGLEWDEKCMLFHENKRPVRTASSDQVRHPIYTSSIERWKKYEKHLQPLLDVLDVKI